MFSLTKNGPKIDSLCLLLTTRKWLHLIISSVIYQLKRATTWQKKSWNSLVLHRIFYLEYSQQQPARVMFPKLPKSTWKNNGRMVLEILQGARPPDLIWASIPFRGVCQHTQPVQVRKQSWGDGWVAEGQLHKREEQCGEHLWPPAASPMVLLRGNVHCVGCSFYI